MHAGNGDAILQPHEFRQHLSALDDRNVQSCRFGDFGIVANDGRTGDDYIGARNILWAMATEDLRSISARRCVTAEDFTSEPEIL